MAENTAHPVGGIDYPRTLMEFDDWFASEAACADFLRRGWPAGFRCPACGGSEAWVTARGQQRCGMPTSDVADRGDDLRTRKPLRLWFQAMWYESEARRQCAWGSTNTAWAVIKRLGHGSISCAGPWFDRAESFWARSRSTKPCGRPGGGVTGRKTNKKSIVAIAAEIRGRGTGVSDRVEDASAESLIPFVQTAVCPGATIRTDGWRAYNGLTGVGFEHQPKNISASGDPAHIVMPQVHRVAVLLDRWWLGIHHGAISASQLDYYLDEFTFRFNRRRSKARGLLFYRLLQQAVQLEPVPYKKLVGGRPSPAPQI